VFLADVSLCTYEVKMQIQAISNVLSKIGNSLSKIDIPDNVYDMDDLFLYIDTFEKQTDTVDDAFKIDTFEKSAC